MRREVRGRGARGVRGTRGVRRRALGGRARGARGWGRVCFVCVYVCVLCVCVCWFVCARAGQGRAGRRRAASGVGEIGDEERRW